MFTLGFKSSWICLCFQALVPEFLGFGQVSSQSETLYRFVLVPFLPLPFISSLTSLPFVVVVSLLERTYLATFWLERGQGHKKVPFSLPPVCCHVCTLAPIPPNPPALFMALSPSPNHSKIHVCTLTHLSSYSFLRLSSLCFLGSCWSQDLVKRATGAH